MTQHGSRRREGAGGDLVAKEADGGAGLHGQLITQPHLKLTVARQGEMPGSGQRQHAHQGEVGLFVQRVAGRQAVEHIGCRVEVAASLQ